MTIYLTIFFILLLFFFIFSIIILIYEASQLNMSTDGDTKLDLPFETTDDINVIQTVNYYFTKMFNIAWLPCDTFEQYLAKIKQYENKYFDIRNFSGIALNSLIIKQTQDLKTKIKEHITKIDFLFVNQRSIGRDLWKMEDIHKKKIFMYNQFFNDHYQSDGSQTDQYIRYLTRLYVNKNFKLNNTTLLRFAIKLNIEFDDEINRRYTILLLLYFTFFL